MTSSTGWTILASLATLLISCGHTGEARSYSKARPTGSDPGGFQTIVIEPDCEGGKRGPRASDADIELAIHTAKKLATILRQARIPDKRAREAAMEGLPVVETVWGLDDDVPLVGPGDDDKPFPVFVSLVVAPGDTKCTGKGLQSNETIQFVRITVKWSVRGRQIPREQWLREGQTSYDYAVRLGAKRGEIFFRGESYSME